MRFFLILFLISSFGTPIFSESLELEKLIVVPQKVYVGDHVDIRLILQDKQLVLEGEIEQIPVIPWGEITEVRVVNGEGGAYVFIRARAYEPGTHFLPEIYIGEYLLEEVSIHIASLYEEGYRTPFTSKGPMLLPGTRTYIGIFVGAVIFVPLLVFWLIFSGRKQLLKWIDRYRSRLPYRRCIKKLRSLRQELSQLSSREFYIQLIDLLRGYLTSKIDKTCFSATASEMDDILSEAINEKSLSQSISHVFHFADRVKFGHFEASSDDRHDHIENSEKVLVELEKRTTL